MIPGATINFGGTEYNVPPINLRIAYALEEQIKTVCQPEADSDFAEYVPAASSILFALFQRNYPDMTRDQFNELLDLPMLRPVMNGLLQMSGYKPRPLVPAATEASASTPPEPISSDTSTLPPDGSPETSSNA